MSNTSDQEWRDIAWEMRAKVEEVVPRLDAQLKAARAALLAITKVRWEDGAGDAADQMQRLASEAYVETAWEMKKPAEAGSGTERED